ncbi:indolepyruvate ferredoxin oxidoreductase family protein [Gammaproteobacteria bacterium AS21]
MNNKQVSITDRYTTEKGQVLISGIQALVRLPMDLMRRDRLNNLNTGTFISGYRGSPLGGYDFELSRRKSLLDEYNIKFQPAVNEELGATAVWGSQQVNLFEGATVDGVCGIWYGKTPGVDRSTDAFRHANAAGSASKGGVLVVAGDDHGCKSSSYPGQSEFAFVDMHMPILNPSNVQEVLDYGIYGIELSRYSGCWVAMITLTENMDSSSTVNIDPDRVQLTTPVNFTMPEGGVNIRLGDSPLAQEERLWRYKRPAAIAFCRENKLNKVVLANKNATLGIVSTGKAHLDLLQAMDDLGIDEARALELGIRILKVAMTYPLDVTEIRDFARGLDYLFVVEEKRSLMEVQLKEELYNVEIYDPHFPKIIGKLDSEDNPLLPAYGELSPAILAKVLLRALPKIADNDTVKYRLDELTSSQECSLKSSLTTTRTPFFCSGCPHNTSTKIPEGSRALAGIGCHYLVQNMDRNTHTFTQMGGEGVSWIGQSAFSTTPHVFTNLGDGTYFHSGVLAIRAAVAAKVNITYKILFNDAVAMTGGQPHDGELRPDMIAQQVLAEGVVKLYVVMDDIHKYRNGKSSKGVLSFAPQAHIRHRDDMDEIQRELRETKGVTVIIYDQMCATELRRQRKRGKIAPSTKKVMINDLVCEGCSDCSVQSNCTSVEPKPTELGIKRQINQTSCNMDMSCVKGFCPSFVSVVGAQLNKPAASTLDFSAMAEQLPHPTISDLAKPFSILVTGVGGTGVVTVGALLAMAAYLEDKAVTVLDQTGLAQKGGAVYSHIRIANSHNHLHAVRIGDASADLLIACDLVAAGNSATCLSKLNPKVTQTIVNTDMIPTSDFVLGRPIDNSNQQIVDEIDKFSATLARVDASQITQGALGNTTTANIFMLGYAYQLGGVPLQTASLYRAIEINGVAVADNIKSFNAGRLAANDLAKLKQNLSIDSQVKEDESLQALIEKRARFLEDYQDVDLANKYLDLMKRVQGVEQKIMADNVELSSAIAQSYFRLLSYKDEYEVARLYTNGQFEQQLKETFSGDYQIQFHLAPEILSIFSKKSPVKKLTYGSWMYKGFKLLAKMKFLRNTAFDPFGYTADRKKERALADDYLVLVNELLTQLNKQNYLLAVQVAQVAQDIRGFGHVKMKSVNESQVRLAQLVSQFKQASGASVQHFDPLAS